MPEKGGDVQQASKRLNTCLLFGLAHHIRYHRDNTESIKFWSKVSKYIRGSGRVEL